MNIGTGAAIFGLSGLKLTKSEKDFFRDYDPLGFILFARNVDTPDQLHRLTDDLRNVVDREAMILVDQEGGRVQRLRAPHWREWAPPFDSVAAFDDRDKAAKAMALRMQILGMELRAVGIDANCAPVCDIARENTHPFLKNRCYGSDPALVAKIARAVADGLMAGGVLPVMKHMPGHGSSLLDTHFELPRVTSSAAQLEEGDFAPFRALNDLPMGMTGHLVFEAFDDHRPATQSPVMVDVIRRKIGFDGLLMTDDLNMQALGGDLTSRTALSMAAGVDIALHCNGDFKQMVEVARAAGAMSAVTLKRAAKVIASRPQPCTADIEALEAELAAL